MEKSPGWYGLIIIIIIIIIIINSIIAFILYDPFCFTCTSSVCFSYFNSIQEGEPTSFSPVSSTNVRISLQNFLTSFNPFGTLV